MEWSMFSILNNVCYPTSPSWAFVLAYNTAVSSSFVLALYILVPSQVRQLDRNNPRQIKWRIFAVGIICCLWMICFPKLFCLEDEKNSPSMDHKSSLAYLGWSWNARQILAISLHTSILFLGPLTSMSLGFYLYTHRHGFQFRGYLLNVRKDNDWIWATLRNFVIAPLTEELVFRGCLIPPFLFCPYHGLSHVQISFVAPLFFGLAHVHHAILKVKQGVCSMKVIVLSTIFQFTYTTLFGAYVSYIFINTSSLPSIFCSHMICNIMGVPDLSFRYLHHDLYKFRYMVWSAYVIGIAMFVDGFYSKWIF